MVVVTGAALAGMGRLVEPPHNAEPKPKATQPEPGHAAPARQAPRPTVETKHEAGAAVKNEPRAEPRAAEAISEDAAPTPESALKRLQEGNQRWTDGRPRNPNTDDQRMRAQAEGGQTPFAAVLTCADSRIPVERAFDCGVGDVFNVRVAGNIAGDHETGSLEYGAEHLKVPLLVVMGHTRCGAVSAAATDAKVEGSIGTLIKAIDPAVERARLQNPSLKGKDLVPAAIKENVWQSVFVLIKSSPIVRERIAHGELRVVGAVYDVASGQVEWLGEHPWQSELIAAFSKPEPAHENATAAGGSEHE
jgi:carbonic anhydrase